jgi:SET domain-containing protein
MSVEITSLEVRETQSGKGLFAKRDIPAGTTLLKIEGKELSFAECVALGDNESYCLQIDIRKYILPHFPFFLSNHSCEPNCGIEPNLLFVTLRNIEAGEELRWDYSTSMLERYWTMECHCGAVTCRKEVDDFDTLPEGLQSKYIAQGIVMPFILELLGY